MLTETITKFCRIWTSSVHLCTIGPFAHKMRVTKYCVTSQLRLEYRFKHFLTERETNTHFIKRCTIRLRSRNICTQIFKPLSTPLTLCSQYQRRYLKPLKKHMKDSNVEKKNTSFGFLQTQVLSFFSKKLPSLK